MKLERMLLPLAIVVLFIGVSAAAREKPRVIVTSDINNGSGDPDDRQSLCHLLFYANELDIRGIIPDRFSATGTEACTIALDLYKLDYNNPKTKYRKYGYPTPAYLRDTALVTTRRAALHRIVEEAKRDDARPLWILAWGNLRTLVDAIAAAPEIVGKLRVISIGTNLRYGADGKQGNWNSPGRSVLFERYPQLWWVEADWTYNGMFPGKEPIQLKDDLAQCGGALGKHIKEVIDTVQWADNFRAGDTPTVLYVIDPHHDLDDPTQPSWAGRYVKPFPKKRPNYWTGVDGGQEWDYARPERTWMNAAAVYQARVDTLLEKRPEMHAAFLAKVKDLYGTKDAPDAENGSRTAALPRFDGTEGLILEAEDAKHSGSIRVAYDNAASNGAYLNMTDDGSIVWRFEYRGKPGEFQAAIRYRLPSGAKKQIVFVNSDKLGAFSFDGAKRQWLMKAFTLHLQRGPNSVVIQKNEGDMQCDALLLGTSGSNSDGEHVEASNEDRASEPRRKTPVFRGSVFSNSIVSGPCD